MKESTLPFTAQDIASNHEDAKYDGELADGLRHNKGRLIWSNGDTYIGSFQEGLRSGYGEFHYKKNETNYIYRGYWRNSMRTGFGIETGISTRACSKYEGKWKNDLYHGVGYLKTTMAYYAGEFMNGIKHGHGFLYFHNGESYEGQFACGHFEGEGIYKYRNNDLYIGQFQNGLRHGDGCHEYCNGEAYFGQFMTGKRHGSGMFFKENGEIRKGEWENGGLKKWVGPLNKFGRKDFSACEDFCKKIKNFKLIEDKVELVTKIEDLKRVALHQAAFRHAKNSSVN